MDDKMLLRIKLKRKKIWECILLKEEGQERIVEWYNKGISTLNTNLRFETTFIDIIDEKADVDNTQYVLMNHVILLTVHLFSYSSLSCPVCNAISIGVTLILDITWSSNDVARNLASDVGIPYVEVDVSISPALLLLDKYLDFRNSTDVSLIFDNPQYVDQALYYWIDSTRLRMMILETLDKITAKKLREIRPYPNNFALVANTQNMNRLLKIVLDEELVTRPDRWNLVFLDFNYDNFEEKLMYNKSINLLTLDKNMCCNLLNRKDFCYCPDSFNLQEEFFKKVLSVIVKSLEALVKDGQKHTNDIRCNATAYDNQTKLSFEEIFENKISRNQLYKNNSIVSVKVEGTIKIGRNESYEVVLRYLNDVMELQQGKTVNPIRPFYRIGITHAIPWSYKEQDPETEEWYWTGYCVDFAKKIAEELDFDFEFVEPKNGDFGKKVNGTWNGVIGDLASGQTDLAVAAIIMTADREEVVDFVAPYYEQTGITIVIRKPVRKTSLFKFMTVLKLEVWLSIVAALIVTGFMVWFLDKYSPYSARNNKKAYPYPCREFTLKESFWFALTSFTPQGGGEAPKALSGRTLVAAYWLFVVLMLATFTANLAAFLTVERMQAPVQSLEQLARQSRINYTVVKNSNTHQYFINMKFAEDTLYRMWKELTLNASTDDTRYRVWDYPIKEQYGHILLAINDSNPVATPEAGFRNVNEHLDADYAFIHDSSEIKYEISRNCNLTEVGEVFAEKPYAVAVQQGSHLQDDLSKTILILQKQRFFEDLRTKYWNHSSKGQCPSTDDNEGITLESLGGVFIATLFGLALAMITLVGEVFYYRRKGKSNAIKSNKAHVFPEKQLKPVPPRLINASTYPVTIGTTFKPVNAKQKGEKDDLRLSHITLYPRARNTITKINN
ncbi:ionotropic receptor 25a [Anoplophora glabripennis]|uniref:ionotropic receptor 25a n=1 Tax=Anoplophora glabripennis TaxID=217634 RepID=UPI000C770B33|nr:ionotropic receptor 25a [Anoplophora glabripennis]